MSFSKNARLNSGPRMEVRNAVRERLPDIVDALDDGASLAGIYRTLISEGCNAGAGPSSFRNALHALRSEMDEIRAMKGLAQVAQPQASEVARGGATGPSSYVDSRNPNQVGRS